jgi:hypothetical protein
MNWLIGFEVYSGRQASLMRSERKSISLCERITSMHSGHLYNHVVRLEEFSKLESLVLIVYEHIVAVDGVDAGPN